MDNTPDNCVLETRIATWNVNGLKKRIAELEIFLDEHDIEVMLLSETHLKASDWVNVRGYQMIRKDRLGKVGGGVAVLFKKGKCVREINIDIAGVEAVAGELLINDKLTTVVAIYWAPSKVLEEGSLAKILKMDGTIIVGGDWNAKHPMWGARTTNRSGRALRREIDQCRRVKLWAPEDYTSIPSSGQFRGDVIDFFLGKGLQGVWSARTVFELNSDHFPVILCNKGGEIEKMKKTKINWRSFEEEAAKVQAKEHEILKEEIDREADELTLTIQSLIQNNSEVIVPNSRNKLGLNAEQKELIKKKNTAKKKWRRSLHDEDRKRYRRLQEKVDQMIKDKKSIEWCNKMDLIAEDDGEMWKFLKFAGIRKQPRTPIRKDDKWLYRDEEKAEFIADKLEVQFSNTKESDRNVTLEAEAFWQQIEREEISDPKTTTIDEVRATIVRMPNRKAPGEDGIPAMVLKKMGTGCLSNLTRLINGIWKYSKFPVRWKRAKVVTIPKGDKDPTKVENRRPISLLNTMARVTEKLLKEEIDIQVEELKLLPGNQFGFRKKMAAVYQVANLTGWAFEVQKRKQKCMAAFFDVEKAYDKVWRKGLLLKMRDAGIEPWILKLLRSWLEDRTFTVRECSGISSLRTAREGVPQGSPISPILFNIFVYDLPSCIIDRRVKVLQFADDTALAVEGGTWDSVQRRMEESTARLGIFFKKWKLGLNETKTEIIQLGRKKAKNIMKIKVGASRVPVKETATYLGIKLDRNLTFKSHTSMRKMCTEKAVQRLWMLTRQASGCHSRVRLRLLKNIAIPKLVYGEEVWDRGTDKAKETIVTAQNKLYRKCFAIPYYISNDQLRRDLEAEDLIKRATSRREKMKKEIEAHEREEISSLAANL